MKSVATATARIAMAALLALSGAATTAFAQTERMTGLKLSGDQPIQIESDRFEVDENQSLATFTGNVSVVQGETVMKAGRMKVFYKSDGGSATTGSADIDRLEVEDGIYVKSETQVATGDRGTFDMDSEVLVLSGNEVVLSEGDNVITGCKLTVQMSNGQARLDSCGGSGAGGRVKMLLTPESRNR